MDWPILGKSVTWFCVASIDDVRLDVGHCIDAQLSSKISRILVVYSVRDFRRIFFVPALVRYQCSLVASKGVSFASRIVCSWTPPTRSSASYVSSVSEQQFDR